MICPKCNRQMIEGYVPTSKMAVLFVPNDGGKIPATILGKGTNTIALTKTPVWKMQKAEAHHCPHCNFVILPIKNEIL